MGKKSVIKWIIVLVLVVGLVLLCRWLSRGVTVRIKNDSPLTIYIIDIYYRYGSTGPITVDAGKSLDVVLGSSAQDYLVMQYLNRNRDVICKPVYEYMMWVPSGGGIGITIDSNGVVTNEIIDLSTGSRHSWH
jgi:hypothetical protein